jgi:hypothetical protein
MSEREALQERIQVLQEALKQGYSLSSPPALSLLDLEVDLLLHLALSISEGGTQKRNPSLRETGEIDSLNNTKIIKIREDRRIFPHPELTYWFHHLAVQMVKLKDQILSPKFIIPDERDSGSAKARRTAYWRRVHPR